MQSLSIQDREDLPQALLWLKDAPMFIDAKKLGDFYDAVVRPPHTEGPTVINVTQESKSKLEGKVGAGVSLGLSKWLSAFGEAKADLKAEAKQGSENTKSDDYTITLEPISTPQRQLEQLTITYLVRYPDRIFLVDNMKDTEWRRQETISKAPRELVFINVPPASIIIPMAIEFADGKIVTIYDKIASANGNSPPEYPSGDLTLGERKLYWKWFADNYRPQQAIELIETATAEHGRIVWADYRMPFTDEGDTIHLHISGSGSYETGIFAYYLIRRTFEWGIRLVGTLKSEPDMHVLAIYET